VGRGPAACFHSLFLQLSTSLCPIKLTVSSPFLISPPFYCTKRMTRFNAGTVQLQR
jgi:hypothetical protein